MKSFVLTCAFAVACFFAFSQSSPAAKVQQARTAREMSEMSQNERAELEFRAEKLCWFEELKDESSVEWYSLSDRNGGTVALTDEMVADFNPLLFNLPQQLIRCENLPVQTTSGKKYLLIVRSDEMMKTEWKRREIQIAKTRNK